MIQLFRKVASFTDAWIETRTHLSCDALGSVASFTDAWIETDGTWPWAFGLIVASFTDAWIETEAEAKSILVTMSHLLQMRGLKLCVADVAFWSSKSHLLQMRGLKLDQGVKYKQVGMSHLLQMRGLKQAPDYINKEELYVASFTDAWIETACALVNWTSKPGRIFYRCVDWNRHNRFSRRCIVVASFTDAWIETYQQ